MRDFDLIRRRMVEEQLAARDIRDPRVLDVFLKVPRHLFVDEELYGSAYNDYPLSIGRGQTISQPYIVALMVQLLNLEGDEKVLEIGTGSGYQTAILVELAKEVFSVERIVTLAEKAKERLEDLNYQNVKVKCDDGALGWKEYAPYEGIIVSAATSAVPEELVIQLKLKGRLIIPLGGSFSQVLTVITKEKKGISQEEVCGCVFVPLLSGKSKN